MITLKGAKEIYQWDINRKIVCHGADTASFAHSRLGKECLTVEVVDCEAFIPNLLLQEGKDLVVWTEKDGETIEAANFEVKRRPMPNAYVYEPTEVVSLIVIQDHLEEMEKRLKILEEMGITGSYESLENKPSIDGNTLVEGMTLADLGLKSATDSDIDALFAAN